MTGIDTVEIDRIEKAASSESFLKRIYTAQELCYYKDKGSKAETLAGMYCVKEAAAKALGTGFSIGIKPSDFEVFHDIHGAPLLILHDKAKQRFIEKFGEDADISISVSHNNTMATAVCYIVKR